MFNTTRPRTAIVAALIAGMALVSGASARADEAATYKTLIDNTSSALVTVKCVLKVQGPGGSNDYDREFTALMLSNDGLVLCASVQLGTSKLMRRLGSITPTDIKVLVGDDTEGVEAKLLATDAELDLSWLQIKEPKKEGYTFVDFGNASVPQLGGKLLSLTRMDKFFDRAPVVNEGRVAGTTKKPRDLIIPSSTLEIEPGMPIFDGSGAAIGVVVVQAPDTDQMNGQRNNATAALILPSAEVVKATKRAKETAAEEAEEEEEADAAPAAEKPAPAPVEAKEAEGKAPEKAAE